MNIGDGQEACAALENGTESEIQVLTALRSVIIQCNDSVLDESDVLRNMMLASDVLSIVILLRPHSIAPNKFYYYTRLFTEFPGLGTLPSSATCFQDGDGVSYDIARCRMAHCSC